MKKEGLRQAYGEQVVELAKTNKNIVSLEADLGGSTFSKLMELAFPERHFEMSIAEQNMTAFAAGLSLTGKIPFTNSFAVFASSRCYEQIRQSIGTAHLNVKIIGSSSGLSDFGDGASHQSIEDIATMRTIPGMVVIEPCDANQTRAAVKTMAEYNGPVYMRLNRADLPLLTDPRETFQIGKLYELRQGTDAVIFVIGIAASIAMEAAEILEKEGISLRIINVSTLKPVKNEDILAYTKDMKAVLTFEEHSIVGGLNSVVCQAIAGKYSGPIEGIAIPDCYGFSTKSYDALMDYFGFNSKSVAEKVRKALAH